MKFVNINKQGLKYQRDKKQTLLKAKKPKLTDRDAKRGTLFKKIAALAKRMEGVIAVSFLDGITVFRRDISAGELRRAFEKRDYDKAMEVIPWDKFEKRIGKIGPPIQEAVGLTAAKIIPELPRQAKELRFDSTNPRVLEFINTEVAGYVREVEQETRAAVQSAIRKAIDEGQSSSQAADRIKQTIGLTEKQEIAVENYRQNQIKAGVKGRKLETRVAAYRKRTINNRAKVIARTEMTRAANQANQEVWNQAVEQGFVDRAKVKKQWIAIVDSRTSDICLSLHGQKVDLDANFVSEHGSWMRPPGHPNCRSELVIEEDL